MCKFTYFTQTGSADEKKQSSLQVHKNKPEYTYAT